MNKRDINLHDRYTLNGTLVEVIDICDHSWFIQDYVKIKYMNIDKSAYINPADLKELAGRKQKVHLI